MKKKVTKKQLNLYFNGVVYAGYCKLQFLLSNYVPFGYNAGVFGWNFDAYNIYGVTIVTGYRNLPGKPAIGVAEYEGKARAIYYDDSKTWDEKRAAIDKLLHEFCKLNGGF